MTSITISMWEEQEHQHKKVATPTWKNMNNITNTIRQQHEKNTTNAKRVA
jgi:hypothetical protein